MRENLDDELTEVKSENAIDRITSQANPRTLERVPAGARFKTRLVMDVLCDEDAPLFLRVLEGLRLLEDDALGGGGSRGSGRVQLRQSEAGVARQELLRHRRGGEGDRRRARPGGDAIGRQRGRVRVHARGVMNPGLVVKLRPSGPWRIGPDSGARNRVDLIYHSDSLYSAVTGAMRAWASWKRGWMRRRGAPAPAVRFSSCFPFIEEIGFVVPPRTMWPPAVAGAEGGAGALEERALHSAGHGGGAAGRRASGREISWSSMGRANAWCLRDGRVRSAWRCAGARRWTG